MQIITNFFQCLEWHCVKIVVIWSFSCPYFPAFGLNTDHKNSEYGLFLHSVTIRNFVTKQNISNCNLEIIQHSMNFVIFGTTRREMNVFLILFSLWIKCIAFLAFCNFQTNAENNTILFKTYCNSLPGRPRTFAQKTCLH